MSATRLILERYQVFVYLAAIAVGVTTARVPYVVAASETLIWPALAALLYVTFTQTPLRTLPEVMGARRFFLAILLLNFLVLPGLVWLLAHALIADPVLLAGAVLVLLVPCTDWFVAFTHLGRGDVKLAVAATPLLLLVQMVALPLYLWLFLGTELVERADTGALVSAFTGLLLAPLMLAGATQRLAARRPLVRRTVDALAWLPVPLLALVLFLVAASQAIHLQGLPEGLWTVGIVFVLYLVLAAGLATALARLLRLNTAPARTLVFSAATRNSFVVLPLALALPPAWQAAVTVVVLQSLVELLGMVFLIRLVPVWLIPARPK